MEEPVVPSPVMSTRSRGAISEEGDPAEEPEPYPLTDDEEEPEGYFDLPDDVAWPSGLARTVENLGKAVDEVPETKKALQTWEQGWETELGESWATSKLTWTGRHQQLIGAAGYSEGAFVQDLAAGLLLAAKVAKRYHAAVSAKDYRVGWLDILDIAVPPHKHTALALDYLLKAMVAVHSKQCCVQERRRIGMPGTEIFQATNIHASIRDHQQTTNIQKVLTSEAELNFPTWIVHYSCGTVANP